MSSLLEALNRIERRLVSLENSPSMGQQRSASTGDFKALTGNPLKTFQEAFLQGDITTITNLLPRLERLMPPGNFVAVASVVAMQGETIGSSALLRTIQNHFDKLDANELKAAITALVQFHVARSTEAEGASDIEPLVTKILASEKLSNEDIAYVYNQLGMIYHGADKYEEALRVIEEAIKHNPSEGSYHFNISIIYEKLKIQSKAVEHAKKSLELKQGQEDADHLSHAVELFFKADLHEDANKALKRLEAVDPSRASFIRATLRNS
jgi:tetratricopeptide (TPR) repeat protein